MINLFLDDCRDAPSNFVIARNVNDALYILANCKVNILSLDHDLGDNQPTGYDLVKVIVESWTQSGDKIYSYPKEIYLHTANGVGRDNMFKLLERYKPEWVKLHRGPMPCND